jgi:2-polyprenyl-3-methyl-5-hydroxy-6-metoxy-1,4-benzoquinol methylase
MVFCLTIFSQEEFIEVYDKLYNSKDAIYNHHAVVEYNMLLENKKIKVGFHRAALLKKNVLNSNCKSVLEIGSGVGLIGSYIRKHDENIKYLGVEIDKESFEKSQSLKLNTINGDFKAIGELNETFDVIMLWEVLEHLQDLDLFIKLAHKRLNKNGKIILSTPNYDKIYNYPNRETDALYQDKPPVHLNFFTKENIINIFEYNQFSNAKVKAKKFPYLDLKSLRFYFEFSKALLNQYNGSTLYFEATKTKE